MFSRQPWIRTHTITEAWSNSTECIWEGPKFLQAKKALSPIYRADPHASSFFKTILSMRNVEYGDLILELQTLAARSNNTSVSLEGEVREIYTVLAGMMRSELETKNIRYVLPAHMRMHSALTIDLARPSTPPASFLQAESG